uniref:DEK_C domain-containing protein n=1 Tax=Schistosoma mansoni TaxID=6183 RepID=A0A3Q0KGE7_SCHMA
MVCDPWIRRLSSEEKENLKPMIFQSQSTDELIETIKDRIGKQVTHADVKTMKSQIFTVGNNGCSTTTTSVD